MPAEKQQQDIMLEEAGPLCAEFYTGAITNTEQVQKHAAFVTIPLKDEGEEVDVNIYTDLPDVAEEMSEMLLNEECTAKVWLQVAKSYILVGKLSESVKVIESAKRSQFVKYSDPTIKLEIDGFMAWCRILEATKLNDSNLWNVASSMVKQLLTSNPHDQMSLLADAVISMSKKANTSKETKFDYETKIFDNLLKKNPRHLYGLMGKAKILFYKRQYSSSLKFFQRILQLNPLLRPDPRIGIGLCYWMLDRKDLANQAWQNSLQVNPMNNIEAKILISIAKFDDCFNTSKSDNEFKLKYEEAMGFTQACYKEDSSNYVLHIIFASYFFALGEYDRVKSICHKIVNDSNAASFLKSDALFWIARCLLMSGDILQSQKTFSESLKYNDNNQLARIGNGQCLVLRGEYSDAIRAFDKILESNNKILEVSYTLGMLHAKAKKDLKLAISNLEKYVKVAQEMNKSIFTSALFTLSALYEESDLSKSLDYLKMAKEEEIKSGKSENEISEILLNNIGVLSLLENNVDEAQSSFEKALNVCKQKYIDSPENEKALEITLKYNIARSKEAKNDPNNTKDALKLYQNILEECPHYTNAKIRYLIISCLSENKNIKQEVENLLSDESSDLQVRSFYGWYLKRFGKQQGLVNSGSKDQETEHHKETLTKYTSHDCYALISLANVYCTMAREMKDQKKKDQYYIRAAQLYHKVLDLDVKNAYAAQGIAIILAEKKQTGLALEFFRKVRDSLNDITVYLNLGHCLVEAKQFAKAIESYELALTRFTNGKDARLLNYFGRAWFLRGVYEKNIESLKMALRYASDSFEISNNVSYKFNKTFIQFTIADFIRKMQPSKRNAQDLIDCIKGVEEAIEVLKSMAENEKRPPYPVDELKLRANMGETLLKQLEKVLQEQKEHDIDFENKLIEAKKVKEETEKKKLEEKLKEEENRKTEETKLRAQRKELEEQQHEWNMLRMEEVKDAQDDTSSTKKSGGRKKRTASESDDEQPRKKKKSAKEKKEKVKKQEKVGKKSSLSNEFIQDSDEEADYSFDEGENDKSSGSDASDAEEQHEEEPQRIERKKIAIDDDEEDDDDDKEEGKTSSTTTKPSLIEDDKEEEEDDDDDGLF